MSARVKGFHEGESRCGVRPRFSVWSPICFGRARELERIYKQTYYGISEILNPLVRGNHVCVLPMEGRYLTIVFELKSGGVARPITGWDMGRAGIGYGNRVIETRCSKSFLDVSGSGHPLGRRHVKRNGEKKV